MKYLIGCIALVFAYTACSPTETIQQEETEPDKPGEKEAATPSWYIEGVHSSSDSLEIHGYSLASASDSSRAVELSTQTAVEYLRLEIDRITEEVREDLADSEGSGNYDSSSFIIQLRNTISELPLDSANLTHQNDSTNAGLYYSYTRATLSRTELYELLENRLQDGLFLEQLNPSSL